MWGQLLPMSVVVLSHIMSICPSTASPLMLPLPSFDLESPSAYDPQPHIPHQPHLSYSDPNHENGALIHTAFLLSSPKYPESTYFLSKYKRGIRHRYEFAPWIVPGGGNGGQDADEVGGPSANGDFMARESGGGVGGVMKEQQQVSGDNWIKSENLANPDSNQNQGQPPQDDMMLLPFSMPVTITRARTVKRSPRCLRRCLAQGLLHPSQCHSLC